MKQQGLPFIYLLFLLSFSCTSSISDTALQTIQKVDKNGFKYEIVNSDPSGLRLYTLSNGLKIYLSKNSNTQKVQTYVAVKAGSVYDPTNNTGLAHYLEHMLFKGTDKIGTLDWKTEKQFLDKISILYEEHKLTDNIIAKRNIYRVIDSLSQEASKISIAGEFHKMMKSIGAIGVNAWTMEEETVYISLIPSNELDRWLMLESERFSKLALRLFHTELETVYEEFNKMQENDGVKISFALRDALFPKHPYGQQTTIGTAEHLKNPSMVAIHNYFEKYYVPNNMAIVLVGNIDFEKTIQKVNDSFGNFKEKNIGFPKKVVEKPIKTPIKKEIFGPESERLILGFRTPGLGTQEEKYLRLIDHILYNKNIGLLDGLNTDQKVRNASSFIGFLSDYGIHSLFGSPKKGQSLEEVEKLLLNQIEKIKKGEFEDWQIEAASANLKLEGVEQLENPGMMYVKSFSHSQNWEDRLRYFDEIGKITKKEVVDFANEFYKHNYAVVYKRKGTSQNLVKMEKPEITPIRLNRDKESSFLKQFEGVGPTAMKPIIVDYVSQIKETSLKNGIPVSYIENSESNRFSIQFVFEMDRDNNKDIELAIEYLKHLGTNKYSAKELKSKFYRYGIKYGFTVNKDKTTFYLNGLQENLPKAVELLIHLLDNVFPDREVFQQYIAKISRKRMNEITDKSKIWPAIINYAKFGENSRWRNVHATEEIKKINPNNLVALIKDLKQYKHRIFYYGGDVDAMTQVLDRKYINTSELKDYPEKSKYRERGTGGNVYLVNYDMVQTEIRFLAKGGVLDPKRIAIAMLFDTYYGKGLSSIVKQEIRESKSLAYAVSFSYTTGSQIGDSDYIEAYFGTQPDKMIQAIDAMQELLNEMPESPKQFIDAKESLLKQLSSYHYSGTTIFWRYEELIKMGINEDNRGELYKTIKNLTIGDLKCFFDENIKDKDYDIMIIGNKNDIDIQALTNYGTVRELDIKHLFKY